MELIIDSRPDVALGLTCDDCELAEPPEVGVDCAHSSQGTVEVTTAVPGIVLVEVDSSQGTVEVSTVVTGIVVVVSTVLFVSPLDVVTSGILVVVEEFQ